MSEKFDLNDFVNEPDIIPINGKDFKLRDLTMAEIIRFQRVFNLATKEIEKALKPVGTFGKLFGVKRRDVLNEGKASEDYKVLKVALDICNPDMPFMPDDFDALTPKQIQVIALKILERNYFFDRKNLAQAVLNKKQ
jgi:hypothetical protein